MVLFRIAIILLIWQLIKMVASKPPRRVVQPVREAPNTVELVKRELSPKEKQAQKDYEYLLTQYIPNLDAMLDIANGELAAANSVSKQEKFLKKVNALEKQIHEAEKKMEKARDILEQV